ncbi:MAG: hypothetical protein BWX44_01107 [Spirochaetes bacterium ADurb.Bin001]|nr:MAG: hypothetical protein BWX44_01107 [Spirochaetes bacterium ADurb.Bin001]
MIPCVHLSTVHRVSFSMPCFLTRNNILGTFFYAPYGKRNGGVLGHPGLKDPYLPGQHCFWPILRSYHIENLIIAPDYRNACAKLLLPCGQEFFDMLYCHAIIIIEIANLMQASSMHSLAKLCR